MTGKGCGYEILTSHLGLGCSSRRGQSITWVSSFLCFGHHDDVGMLSSGAPSYLRIGKGQLDNDRTLPGVITGGYPTNEHMSISRIEQLKHSESKVGQCNKKFRADRQSFIA